MQHSIIEVETRLSETGNVQAPRVVDPKGRSYNRMVTAINQPPLRHGAALIADARRGSPQFAAVA